MSLEVSALPTLNALLNATTTLLLLRGWWLIRRKRIAEHRRTMLAALATSALFLASYLVYHFQVGSVRFQGTGAVRTLYLSILLSHTLLAAANRSFGTCVRSMSFNAARCLRITRSIGSRFFSYPGNGPP